jgi:hypothetical protein
MANVLVIRASYRKAYPIIESLKRAGYRVIAGIDTMVSEARSNLFLLKEYCFFILRI